MNNNHTEFRGLRSTEPGGGPPAPR